MYRKYSCEHCIKTKDAPEVYNQICDDLMVHFGDDAKFCPYCGRCLEKPDYRKVVPMTTNLRECASAFEGEVEESHESYAQASFSRISTTKNDADTLYGSSIRHNNIISFKIKRSYKTVSKYGDHYFAGGLPLIEIQMSQSQFAEMITSMNMGEGVPVTLKSVRGEIMAKCPEWSQQEKMQNDVRITMDKMADKLATHTERVYEIINKKGAINVGERKEISNAFSTFTNEIRSNLPFLTECMGEAMDKTLTIAKGEIEAFYTHAIQRAGIEYINSGNRVTIEGIKPYELEVSDLGGYNIKGEKENE